ncbi:MAG: helix-turn-helix domain-containing protein [Clostridia bacterium]|nr:helix-turn-helix domain-containing protein [Clostridia bacterium]
MAERNLLQPKRLFSISKFVSAYYFEFLPNESYTSDRIRSYDFYSVFFVARGERYICVNGVHYHLFDGDMMLIAPHTPHQILQSDNFISNDFCFYTFTSKSPKLNKLKNRVFSLNNKERSLFLNAIFSIIPRIIHIRDVPNLYGFRLSEDVSPDVLSLSVQYMELLLTTLYLDRYNLLSASPLLNVSATSQDTPVDTDLTARIKQFLLENIDKKISLTDVTRHMCMSLSGLEKNFKKDTGYSIIEYLNVLRLNRIKNLILYTDQNLTEIAKQTGFSNIQYFSKFFKTHTGFSPSEYAKQRVKSSLHSGRTLKLANPKNRTNQN